MKRALFLVLLLAACVSDQTPDPEVVGGVLEGTPVQVGDRTIGAQQFDDHPVMIMAVDAQGNSQVVRSGSGPTVVISSAPDFATAVQALGQFCGRKIDIKGFDTQFVYREPSSGDYWFDGFCG